ncbi:LacI family DNA-binding transcriptional regulator [Ensifer sp. YR511]|uniref:LacI family DNA-binding transcriptional regulator n=1 Tax=Ensifer sp. YR511 TaxID=1855294 RepID=UPI00088F755E|nr:LacI family DNA-binding transcriptional regulator [Ensifer sp. YR511]SDO17162.1 transcriptional regulator, LacI family [Ensifer sp. YR511]
MMDTTDTGLLRKATLQEVSLAAGVSTATVSRYLNDRSSVSEKTQVRVQAAIDRLGYVSNALARALASRRSMTMGVMVPSLTSTVAARTLDAFRSRLYSSSYGVLLSSYAADRDGAVEATRRLLEREVDGLLLIGGETHPEMVELVKRQAKPFVVTWMPSGGEGPPFISYDHCAAMELVADHLLSLGHRRFGFVVGNTVRNPRFAERLLAVRARIEASGGILDQEHVAETPTNWIEGRRAVRTLLGAPGPRPTAIIAVNDILAAATVLECQSQGISVPGEISVTGSGNSDLAESLIPSLTTLTTPKTEIGRTAADYLLARVDGKPAEANITIAVGLEVRGSSGPPPAGS